METLRDRMEADLKFGGYIPSTRKLRASSRTPTAGCFGVPGKAPRWRSEWYAHG